MAFFSGTDERDDRSSICYSGVVGKLDTATPQIIFRFNAQEKKIEVPLTDIFGDPDFVVPQEWLDKVSVSAPAYRMPNTDWYKGKTRVPGYPSYPLAGVDDDDAFDWARYGMGEDDPGRFHQGHNQTGLNRKERRQLAKINTYSRQSSFAGLPSITNPSLKYLQPFEYSTDIEPGEDMDEEILKSCPELFNHVVLETIEYPSLRTVALYALIGGLAEDFHIPNPITTSKIVKCYDNSEKDIEYKFTSVFKEFVMRPYFNRRLKGVLVSEKELNEAVLATVEDAWSVFLLINLT